MRPVLWGDLVAATAWAAANPARPVAALLDRAQAADLYRKHHGRPHPRWGNGSLMAAALAEAAPPVRFDDPTALAALAQVAGALARRRAGALAHWPRLPYLLDLTKIRRRGSWRNVGQKLRRSTRSGPGSVPRPRRRCGPNPCSAV